MAGLVDAARAKSPYFRLLARDPEVLEARTPHRQGHLLHPEAGLPRAERELARRRDLALQRLYYCASVHARFAATIPSGSRTSIHIPSPLDPQLGVGFRRTL